MQQALRQALPIVAAAYGEKFGVEVLVQGPDAYTDGKQIVIPAAHPDDPRYQQVAWGYLAHEAAHIRHTDFNVVASTAGNPLRRALLNILEDVRIEEALARDYPGTRRTIHTVLAQMVERGLMAVPTDPHPAALLQSWLLLRLRSRLLGQSVLTPLYAATERLFRSAFPTATADALTRLADRAQALASTTEALALADALLQCLHQALQTVEQAAEKAEEQGSEATPAEPPAESAEPWAGEQPALPAPATTLRTVLDAEDGDLAPDVFAQVAEMLGAQASQQQWPRSLTLPVAEVAQPGRAQLLQRCAQESARLRARLRGLVQASRHCNPQPRTHGRHIATRKLAGIATGETRLFIRQHQRVAPNAAVHVLVDVSGSMNQETGVPDRRRCHIANEAALALALALEGIPGVSLGVSVFPGRKRTVAVVLQPRQCVRSQAAVFDQSPRGGTPLAEALWYAARQLLQEPHARKLLLVLTDGDPDDRPAVVDILQRCQRAGYEVLGIGIQTRSVQRLFTNSRVIHDVADLKHQLLDVTRQLLLAS